MTTQSVHTLTTAAIQPLHRLFKEHGLNMDDLTDFNDDARQKHMLNPRMSITQFDRILEQASRILNEPAIGFEIGRRLEFSNFYLLSFLLSGCDTGREVLTLLRRYYALIISDSHAPDLFVGQESIKLVFYVADGTGVGCQARSELVATGVHSAGSAFGSSLYQPFGVGFCHSAPSYHKKMEQFFGVPISYNQPHNWISFSSKLLDKPLLKANPTLFNGLIRKADKAMKSYSHLKDFSSKVMLILHQWPDSIPITKEAVAELMNTSSRTLTRRLQEEDCQFSNLLRDVRLEKAKQALEEGYADVQQLAVDLGFSDRRGFERAFKQWTGETPAAYRKNHIEQSEAETL